MKSTVIYITFHLLKNCHIIIKTEVCSVLNYRFILELQYSVIHGLFPQQVMADFHLMAKQVLLLGCSVSKTNSTCIAACFVIQEVLNPLVTYHRFISFSLYVAGLCGFVFSLRKKNYLKQFTMVGTLCFSIRQCNSLLLPNYTVSRKKTFTPFICDNLVRHHPVLDGNIP